MRAIGLIVAVTFVATGATWAMANVERCTKIENNLKRLACYDEELGFESEIIETVSGAGDWRVRTQTSKIDDSTNVFLSLPSEDWTNCRYDTKRHIMYIACRENTTALWITFGGCFMSSVQGGGQVTYRLDSEKAKDKNFRVSNDNSALGLWTGSRAIPLIKEMLGYNQPGAEPYQNMLVRATPFSESRVLGEYNISGINEAIKPLREACNW